MTGGWLCSLLFFVARANDSSKASSTTVSEETTTQQTTAEETTAGVYTRPLKVMGIEEHDLLDVWLDGKWHDTYGNGVGLQGALFFPSDSYVLGNDYHYDSAIAEKDVQTVVYTSLFDIDGTLQRTSTGKIYTRNIERPHWAGKNMIGIQGIPDVTLAPMDPVGYTVNPIVLFNHRKWNMSESTFAIKYYTVSFPTKSCSKKYDGVCGSGAFSTDAELKKCLLQIDKSCTVTVSGFWNFTSVHAPDICCSNTFGLRLPSPGNIVPRSECTYGTIIAHNVMSRALREMAGGSEGSKDLIKPNFWYSLARQPQEHSMLESATCYMINGDPLLRGCQAHIQFGKDYPDVECSRPTVDKSLVISYRDFLVWESEIGLSSIVREKYDSGFRARNMQNGPRMNFSFDVEHYRTYFRDFDGFTMNIPGFQSLEWCGSAFTGIEVPFVCTTSGFLDRAIYEAPMSDAEKYAERVNPVHDGSFFCGRAQQIALRHRQARCR